MEQDIKSTIKDLKAIWKVEEDFYANLREETIKADLKTPEEIESFYKGFMRKYKLKLRTEPNFKKFQSKIEKENYIGKIKKDKNIGLDKAVKFHTGWNGLLIEKESGSIN